MPSTGLHPPSVIVVGAGIGGLSAALSLAVAGAQVTVLEAGARAGGKLREQIAGGAAIDAGPTVLTMRWVFDELCESAGAGFGELVGLRPAAVLARHAWDAHARLDLHADLERSVDAIGAFAGAAEAARYRAFCARAARVYRTLEGPFLRGTRPTPLSLAWRAGLRGLPALARIAPFATLWTALGEHFHDPRLRQLFGRYATYCGSSPWQAPATLMLVAHVERAGVWLVDGGMARIPEALVALLRRHGGRLRCGAPVRRVVVERGRACGVELDAGERLEADAIVFNGDPAALQAGLLGPEARAVLPAARAERSASALTWTLRARTAGFELERHNVFFGADYAQEFDAVFRRGRLPADPTVYVCAQDRGHADAPAGSAAQRLLCLVNAPANGDRDGPDDEEMRRCESTMWQRLAACGLTIEPEAPPLRTTPVDFARLFPGTGGALYGATSHGWQASFRRPAQRTRLPGLFLCGGATHPGPGVPMAALSGRLAAQAVLAALATRRISVPLSRPAATPGGTSTR